MPLAMTTQHKDVEIARYDLDFDGRRVLVTGATRGIGRGIAAAFASQGARVAIAARDAAAEVATELSSSYEAECIGLSLDVTQPESVATVFEAIMETWGGLDILVNNAGIANSVTIDDLDEIAWRRILDTNVDGVYRCCRAALKLMQAGGAIVNIASISGSMVNVPQFQANYNTSKAAVIMLTRSLAVELANRHIRVNSVSPGYTLTDMNKRPEVKDLTRIWSERTPLRRLANISEIAGPVLFLASDLASYITGHDLVVDGGITILC